MPKISDHALRNFRIKQAALQEEEDEVLGLHSFQKYKHASYSAMNSLAPRFEEGKLIVDTKRERSFISKRVHLNVSHAGKISFRKVRNIYAKVKDKLQEEDLTVSMKDTRVSNNYYHKLSNPAISITIKK